MMSDIEAKTYEYGMLRALGFHRKLLIGVIYMKSLSFSLPGLVFGIMVAFVLNVGLRMMVFIDSDNFTDYRLTIVSIVIGGLLGLVMPAVSNYAPIKAAMRKNVRSSLDLKRRNKEEISLRV